jgi:carboxyl-terminal processing protease
LEDITEALGLIIDVRNNPGGLLQSVVDVISHFIDGGLILYEVDGEGRHQEWEASAGTTLNNAPLVVLINEGSASGSEVLAGALRDREEVPLVGVTTFGKGSVNTLRGLNDGSGVYFTTARWHTPGGILLEGKGISPDVEVLQDEDSADDLQMEAAIQVLEELIQAGS